MDSEYLASEHLTKLQLMKVAFGSVPSYAEWEWRWYQRHFKVCGLCRGKHELLARLDDSVPSDSSDGEEAWDRLWEEVDEILSVETTTDLASLFRKLSAPVPAPAP